MTHKPGGRIVVAVAAAFVLLPLLGLGARSTHEIQGSRSIAVTLGPASGTISQADFDQAAVILRTRLHRLGDQGSVTHREGSQTIVVRLDAGFVTMARRQAKLISERGQLALYDLTPSLLAPSIDASQNAVPDTSLFDLLSHVETGQPGKPSAYYLFNTRSKRLLAGPTDTPTQLLSGHRGKTPTGARVLTTPPKTVVVSCSSAFALACPGLTMKPTSRVTYYYLFKQGSYPGDPENPYPQLTGADLDASATRAATDPTIGAPIVTIQFTDTGDKLFHQITRDEAQRGESLGIQQSFAIVLDNRAYSFPTIDYTHYPDGIDVTRTGAEITGLTSTTEAKKIASVLQSGALPTQFTVISAIASG